MLQLGHDVRAEVLQKTGIPVGVGIAPTKTLAKLANAAAKRWQRQTGGVVDIREPHRRDRLLQVMAVGEVWGIGRRLQAHLLDMGIKTAWDLAKADPRLLRKRFSVVVEKTARELLGVACLEMEPQAPAKREICCSRSFGHRVHALDELREAVATYATRAGEKLRQQQSLCSLLHVGIRTGLFNTNEERVSLSVTCHLPYPTDDTRLLVQSAIAGLDQIYKAGPAYAKASVMLMDLCQRHEYTPDLFAPTQPAGTDQLMQTMDQINQRWGKGTIRPGRVPTKSEWQMQRQLLSPAFTTRFDQLWTVRAGN